MRDRQLIREKIETARDRLAQVFMEDFDVNASSTSGILQFAEALRALDTIEWELCSEDGTEPARG